MTNSKTTRRALLSSLLAIFLCVAMLVGTTFAWFTDTASTAVNTIQAGELKIELLDKEGESLEGRSLAWEKAEGHENEAILWEPGVTYNLEQVTVKNVGNLALRYSIEITGINGDAKLNEAIEWTFEGIDDGHLLAGESAEIVISGHMLETAGNEYQGLSIEGIAITVHATQYTHEYDSYDNTYDANAPFTSYWDGASEVVPTEPDAWENGEYHITNAAEFVGIMNRTNQGATNSWALGKTIVLDCDIDLGGRTIAGFGSGNDNIAFTFDGNDHTVSNFKIDTDSRYAGLFNQVSHGGYIKNVTVKGAVINGKSAVGAVVSSLDGGTAENCKAYNCSLNGKHQVGSVVGYAAGSTVKDCYAENCTVVYSADAEYQDVNCQVLGYDNVATTNTISGNTYLNVTVAGNGQAVANGVVKSGNTYLISSAEGLQWFNDQANKNGKSFGGTTVKLACDIDMQNAAWLPAGQNFDYDYADLGYSNTVQFNGVFDGNGKTISNIKITGLTGDQVNALSTTAAAGSSASDHSMYSVGFIGYANGTIKNLTIKNSEVVGFHYVGTILGYSDAASLIDNCHVENVTVSASHLSEDQCGDKVGGIVGNLNDTVSGADIKNCSVKNSEITGSRDVGQVIGCAQNGSSYENCTAVNVTVSDAGDCTHANINNSIIGRDLR